MTIQISEQLVDSILSGDKESFMQQFQAAIASKVSDALDVRKVEVASTLITPADSTDQVTEVSADETEPSQETEE